MMKTAMVFFALALTLLTTTEAFAVRGYNGTTDLKNFSALKCGSGLVCSKNKDIMTMATTGGIKSRILASAAVLTSSACGTTVYNAGAVTSTLPLASANIGCLITFAVTNASNFDVRTNVADQILILTTGVGRAARSATLGNTLKVEATAAGQWSVMSIYGTWTDTP